MRILLLLAIAAALQACGGGSPDGATPSASPLNRFIFTNATQADGVELWVSGGTAGTTALLSDINPNKESDGSGVSSTPSGLTTLGDGRVLFFADRRQAAGSDNLSRGLWITDGTTAGTQLVRDPPTASGVRFGRRIVPVGRDKALFIATNLVTESDDLWVTNGTAAGTMQLKDFAPGVPPVMRSRNVRLGFTGLGSSSSFFDTPPFMSVTNGRVLFVVTIRSASAPLGIDDREIWSTDGTPEGTIRLGSFPGRGLVNFIPQPDGNLWLGVSSFTSNNTELWATDGTTAGTRKLLDLADIGFTEFMTLSNGRAFFTGNGVVAVTDGTAQGTRVLLRLDARPVPILQGTLNAQNRDVAPPQNFVPQPDGTVRFLATEHLAADALQQRDFTLLSCWVTDGTAAGTRLLERRSEVGIGTVCDGATALSNGTRLLTARSTAFAHTGTQNSFVQLLATPPSGFFVIPNLFTPLPGNKLALFQVRSAISASVVETFVTDGTPQGTFRLADNPSVVDGTLTGTRRLAPVDLLLTGPQRSALSSSSQEFAVAGPRR